MFPCRRRSQSVARAILAAALLCAAAGASGQSVHRVVDAEGRITYTDRPAAETPRQAATDHRLIVANALASNAPIASRLAATVDAKEAARRLEQAQLVRRQGAQPLPGERVQGSGTGAPNERYWRRQERLRIAVEQAQRRLNEARR